MMNRNPVLVKELRGRMRGGRAFVILTAFLLTLAIPATLLYLIAAQDLSSNAFNAGQTIGRTLFVGISFIALVQVLIVVPGQAASAITSEKERETYDLLISTLLPPWKIVLGKLMASMAYALLLIVAVVPFMAVSFLFGGVTLLEVVLALLGLVVTVLLFGSMGILWSTILKRSLASTIVTQATTALIILGIPFLMAAFALIFLRGFGQPEWIASPLFYYPWIILVSIHPFVALGSSEILLSQDEARLFMPAEIAASSPYIPANGVDIAALGDYWVPHPWLLFTVEGLLLTAVLVFWSVRLLRPDE